MSRKAFQLSIFYYGYTLIEMMIAMALAAIFVLATLTIATMSLHSYRKQERVSDVQQRVRAALDLMARDIRMAGYDPLAISHGPTAGIGILVADDRLLQISADLNADQSDNSGLENMTYFFDPAGKRLRQKEGGRAYAQTFIDHVASLKFDYLNAKGETAADKSDITAVIVTLTVEERNRKGVLIQRTLCTRVNCRNLSL